MRHSILTIGKHWPIKPAVGCCRCSRVGPNIAKPTRLLLSGMLAWANGVTRAAPCRGSGVGPHRLGSHCAHGLAWARCMHHSILTIGKHWPIKPAAGCCRYCRVGPHAVKLAGWLLARMLAWANGVNGLPLTEGVEFPTETWRL